MTSSAPLMPATPLIHPPLISTSPAADSPTPASVTSSSPPPSIAPIGNHPFRADFLSADITGAPVGVLPPSKPVYATPSPVENTPQNNECKMVEVKGAKLASFTVKDTELICLPQAFDLFLKHLVGGLHTVYTKLKRLDITPVVCNVEQVRVLRGLGAIQPGVNRCKLISRKDLETLYNDCTNASSRPGRPPKRSQSVTSDSGHLLSHSVSGLMSAGIMPPTGLTAAALAEVMKAKKIKLEVMAGYHGNRLAGQDAENGEHTHLGLDHLPFMMMSHPLIPASLAPASVSMAMSQMNHLSTLANMASSTHNRTLNHTTSRLATSVIKERVGDSPSPSASLDEGRRSGSHISSSSVSSSPAHTEHPADRTHVHQNGTLSSHALLGHSPSALPGSKEADLATVPPSVVDSSAKQNLEDRGEMPLLQAGTRDRGGCDRVSLPGQKLDSGYPSPFLYPEGLSSIETLLTNIQQGLLKVAIDNARAQEKQVQLERSELKMELYRERELRETLERQLDIEQRSRVLIQKRLKKEKKTKRRLQEALEVETKLRDQAEQSLQHPGGLDSLTQQHDMMGQDDISNHDNLRTDTKPMMQDGRLFLKTTVMY